MSLSFGNYINCLLIIGLSNTLTIVTQGGIPVKLHKNLVLQIQLFDHTVLPILLYGSEVWGFTNTNMIDVLHNQFLRSITKLRKSTPTYMLYAELGRVPIDLHIKKQIISYWISLINGSS